MNKITIEKYKVCKEACFVLINTKYAQLWHIVSRSKPIRVEYLENIRDNYLSSIL
jgi:hypothetical protein